jgi:alkanesulfonate monooxygenase SsuD/methylene tetrahydromethanopterin reductase-like flavin-dependent oxidoreductase (luciferase family)
MSLARLGVGLWTFQSTATRPANLPGLYRELVGQAALLDELGFHSLWTAEHRLWYDGWCPALLHAAASAVAATKTLRFGNAMLLGPQHDPAWLARNVATLDRLSGGRVDLGLGLGHRDAEFDALGLRRDRRGRLMEAVLEELDRPVWIGGMAQAALDRAARGGHRLMLPQTVRVDELARFVDAFDGEVGVMRDVWVGEETDAFAAAMERHYREEAGAWWVLRGEVGFSAPDLLDKQLARVRECAVIGSPERVAEGLSALFAAGASLVMLRLVFDFTGDAQIREQIERVAKEVAPLL